MPSDSKANEVNHVYILGAGFSKPLGCPLFTDLFSESYNRIVPSLNYQESPESYILSRIVREMPVAFHKLKNSSNVKDPEHFLELCDYATLPLYGWFYESYRDNLVWLDSAYSDAQLCFHDNDVLEQLVSAARIRLALETNHMVTTTSENSERWLPFERWFRGLGKTDSIISLNYDLLVETVAKKIGRPFPGRDFYKQDDIASVEELLSENLEHANLPLLCKLHGSVDWVMRDRKAYAKRYSVFDYFEGYPPLLGTPGNGKIRLFEECLRRVWLTAIERLREAHVISIVGYSMPETDNDFRIKLLDAIVGTNGNLKAINIVVGSPSPQSQRARAILEQATRLFAPDDHRPTVNLLPIYAQDYLPWYRPAKETEIRDHAFPGV
jgi:hypothetical protein